MDIQQSPSSLPHVNKECLKNVITQILLTNTAYDCMPINSSIASISKQASLYDAINIIINQNLEQLLVWDESLNRWIWMLTIVDAIRLIMHALKTIAMEGRVNFRNFQSMKHHGTTKHLSQITKVQIQGMISIFANKKLSQIIVQINQATTTSIHQIPEESVESDFIQQNLQIDKQTVQPHHLSFSSLVQQPLYSQKRPPLPPSRSRPYIRLKSVVKESKLSYVILTMIVQKIHRILIEDIQSKMIISVLSFKDILLYLLRIANQSSTAYYQYVTIQSLLETVKIKSIQICQDRPIWQAFQIMTDIQRSLWINVVDQNGSFLGMLFRQDFRNIFKGWHIDYLWMKAGQFIKLKRQNYKGHIPEYRFFQPGNITKQIIWKIVMTRGNAIVWVDQKNNNKVKATIGLMQLFSLFVN